MVVRLMKLESQWRRIGDYLSPFLLSFNHNPCYILCLIYFSQLFILTEAPQSIGRTPTRSAYDDVNSAMKAIAPVYNFAAAITFISEFLTSSMSLSYVFFEFGDIEANYVGIDINSLQSNAFVTAGLISVTISPTSSKPKNPILSFVMDLSTIFHATLYAGFIASTGLLAGSHFITGWSYEMNGLPLTLDLSYLPQLPGPKKKQTFMIIWVSVSVLSLH
ncbi:hypothetical protein TanjilG_27278 [Lupinus angustifolius]|uniref:Legume lectin domain-containing protein n=1 Tax=Lupinus angustifolius TaxID=3871 RepID=A0A394DGZ7_LUPAN|nr:hypothetical protein TanjilG_27278 [Lupinus angustifolius]